MARYYDGSFMPDYREKFYCPRNDECGGAGPTCDDCDESNVQVLRNTGNRCDRIVTGGSPRIVCNSNDDHDPPSNVPEEGIKCYERKLDDFGSPVCEEYWVTRAPHGVCGEFQYDTYCLPENRGGGVPCLPLLKHLGQGFHILEDSTDADMLTQLDRPLVLKQTFGSNQVVVESSSYLTTSEVTVAEVNTATSSGQSNSYSKASAFFEDRALSLNVEGSYGVVGGSAAIQGGVSVKGALEQNKQYAEYVSNFPKYHIKAKSDLTDDDFSPSLLGYADSENFDWDSATLEESKARMKFMVNLFGTHYVSQITVGGRLSITTEQSACATEQEISQSIETQACASANFAIKSVGGCVSGSLSEGESDSTSASSSGCALKVEGGDHSACSHGSCDEGNACDRDTWAAGILESDRTTLAPLSFQLRPITDLLDSVEGCEGTCAVLKETIKELWEEAIATNAAAEEIEAVCEQEQHEPNGGFAPRVGMMANLLVALAVRANF
jgi:hypothetical protein